MIPRKFYVDKRCDVPLFFPSMSESPQKLTSPASLLVDAILVIGFFCYIYTVISPHVPSQNAKWVLIWGGLSAACMSAVFWLALQMFRVVFRFQREQAATRRK